jgi:hypothetical protein
MSAVGGDLVARHYAVTPAASDIQVGCAGCILTRLLSSVHNGHHNCVVVVVLLPVVQVKRQRDKLRPYLVQAGVLPDATQKDKDVITLTHLHQLARHWGLVKQDPDFLSKYPSDRTLLAVLVEHTAIVDMLDEEAVVRPSAVHPSVC